MRRTCRRDMPTARSRPSSRVRSWIDSASVFTIPNSDTITARNSSAYTTPRIVLSCSPIASLSSSWFCDLDGGVLRGQDVVDLPSHRLHVGAVAEPDEHVRGVLALAVRLGKLVGGHEIPVEVGVVVERAAHGVVDLAPRGGGGGERVAHLESLRLRKPLVNHRVGRRPAPPATCPSPPASRAPARSRPSPARPAWSTRPRPPPRCCTKRMRRGHLHAVQAPTASEARTGMSEKPSVLLSDQVARERPCRARRRSTD